MLDRDGSMAAANRLGDATPSPTMAIPMIPGLMSTQRHFIGRTNFHRGQLLEQMTQGRLNEGLSLSTLSAKQQQQVEASPSAWLNVAEHHRLKTTLKTTNHSPPEPTTNQTSSSSTKYRTDATQPKWITHDRQVLRFFGYFIEPIVQETHTASVQQQRVRRVIVFFYLSDHSLSISEPRVVNSGLPQGEFMKRMIPTAPSGGTFEPEDFHVGGHVRLYGRTIHLVDCDEATRTFYDEARGQPQGSPCKYPDDRSSKVDEIDALKERLKAKAAAVAESKTERVRKFHELSQRVLRFYVSWQDPHPLYPETRHYVLHYYLEDDTMEIVEPRTEREGRGHFAVLLSRRRMVSDASNKDRAINERDLRCGDYVHVFSRRFLLEDCDPFTREYYLDTHGITQETFEPDAHARREKATKWKLFQVDPTEVLTRVEGVERVQQLRGERTAHAKTQLFYQNDALEKKQLRFRARFFHGRQQPNMDASTQREFVLTFYLEDETLSVFEPRVKNSGVLGGRFLDRGRFRKCVKPEDRSDLLSRSREKDTEKLMFRASDFYVGAVIAFEFAPKQQLELVEADRQTLTYCESHPNTFPYSDIHAVLKAVVTSKSVMKTASIRRAFRAVDTARNGTLQVGDVRRILETLGITNELNAQQLVTLCRQYEERMDGEESPLTGAGPLPFVYDDFCDALTSQSRHQTANGDVFAKLRTCSGLRSRLRTADKGQQRVVDGAELVQVAAAYNVIISNSEMLAISNRFPGHHRQRRGVVDYNALCDRVFDGMGDEKLETPREPHRVEQADQGRLQQSRGRDHEEEEDNAWATQNQYSLGRHQLEDAQSNDSFDRFGDEDQGDACLPHETMQGGKASYRPMASPRRQAYHPVPPLPRPLGVRPSSSALMAPRRDNSSTTAGGNATAKPTNAHVVALLRRVFGDRKYQLRKALRDRDHDKSGFLSEEVFMDAVLAVEPRLSDDDTYLIADVYFPTNNSQLDYPKLLETAFRS